jgi:hypothetical protein
MFVHHSVLSLVHTSITCATSPPLPHIFCASPLLSCCAGVKEPSCAAQGPFNCLTILLLRFWCGILGRHRTRPLSDHRLQCRGVCLFAGVLPGRGCRQKQQSGGASTESGRSRDLFTRVPKGIRGVAVVSDACRTSSGPPSEHK